MRARSVLDSLATLAARRDAASLGTMQALLARTERWSSEELEAHQLLRLGALVNHARETVPFYSQVTSLPAETLTLDEFRELPLLRREDVRERGGELVSRHIPKDHQIVREANSSGSTGRHVTVQVDAVSEGIGHALALRDGAWHGRDPRRKAAGIRAIPTGADAPLGRTESRWSPAPESGPLCLLDVHTSAALQLEWLVRESPAYLATYPSNAAGLLELAEREHVRVPGLLELGTFGEVLSPVLRETCRRVWGVPLVDAYSSVETGYLALQCPVSEQYHVQSEHVLVEVLRPDGSPCVEGETGRVVVTALHAFAMPLLRYDIGDYATVGAPCACGRGLPVLERIEGRARNRIVLPSGERIWPRFGSNVLGKLFPVKQFRLVQPRARELVLELVVDRTLTLDEERRLRDFVLSVLRHPFEITLAVVETIPRSQGGKFEDVVCEVG